MAARKYDFTIDRRDGRRERTVVGKTGRQHHPDAAGPGRDGHFTDEGQYRRAIECAVARNTQG